jgi:nucleoside-diphosphate-sugar epimerase
VQWRVAHEDAAFDLGELGVAVSVMTVAIVFGGTGGILGPWWAEARERGTVTYPGDGAQHWPLVHRDDVAAAYALAAEHARGGERYLITDDSQFTVRELADAVARATGATAQPRPAAELIAELGGYGEALLCDQRLSAAKARRELGWVPQHAPFVASADELYREWQAGIRAPVA